MPYILVTTVIRFSAHTLCGAEMQSLTCGQLQNLSCWFLQISKKMLVSLSCLHTLIWSHLVVCWRRYRRVCSEQRRL